MEITCKNLQANLTRNFRAYVRHNGRNNRNGWHSGARLYNSSYTLYEIPNLIKIIELAARLTK